jgi:hypothetical protein
MTWWRTDDTEPGKGHSKFPKPPLLKCLIIHRSPPGFCQGRRFGYKSQLRLLLQSFALFISKLNPNAFGICRLLDDHHLLVGLLPQAVFFEVSEEVLIYFGDSGLARSRFLAFISCCCHFSYSYYAPCSPFNGCKPPWCQDKTIPNLLAPATVPKTKWASWIAGLASLIKPSFKGSDTPWCEDTKQYQT